MANQTFDTTVANAVLKELYQGQICEKMLYEDHPAYAIIPKKTDFGGRNYPLPVMYGTSQGRSAVFATAQSNQSANIYTEFLLTRVSDYSLATISNELLLAATTDRESFIRSATAVVDGAIYAATRSLTSALFRSGTGTIGQISSITSGVITLTNAADVVQFEKNMVLECAATDGGAAYGSPTYGYVIARDPVAGTVTVSGTFNSTAGDPSGWSTGNPYLRVAGDRNAKITGFDGWISSAGVASLFGVDTRVDTRLRGFVLDKSAMSIEEGLIDAITFMAQEGANPKVAITNFSSWAALEKSMGSKVQYVDLKAGEIAFRGIMVNGPRGQIKVFPDLDCQSQTAWIINPEDWVLASLGDAPMILKYGSNDEMLRVYNADSAELRCGYYAQLGCKRPGGQAKVLLSA